MTPFSEILSSLQRDPYDRRLRRVVVRETMALVGRNLRTRLDYETTQEIANDTANAVLSKAESGAELNFGIVVGIARNLYRKHVERATAQKRQPLEAADVLTEHFDASLEHHEVVAAVEALPDSVGKVIVLRYWGNEPVRICCERLGLSPQNVRTLERRGLDQLRDALLA